MRKAILLFVVLVGISLSCVEFAELLTLSDDASNDFVLLLSSKKCSLRQVTKVPPAAVPFDLNRAVESNPSPFWLVFADFALSSQNPTYECIVQRK
jgi:hypothetical protein